MTESVEHNLKRGRNNDEFNEERNVKRLNKIKSEPNVGADADSISESLQDEMTDQQFTQEYDGESDSDYYSESSDDEEEDNVDGTGPTTKKDIDVTLKDESNSTSSIHVTKTNNGHKLNVLPLNLKRIAREKPSVYEASNLEVISYATLKFKKPRTLNADYVRIDNSRVPKLKKEFLESGLFKKPTGIKDVHYKSPDEVLSENYGFAPHELVYLTRDEIKVLNGVDLPGEEILNLIHYYVADRIRKKLNISEEEYNEKYAKCMDGSALLALGALVTKWVDDLCGDSTFKSHMERVRDDTKVKVGSIDEFLRVYDEEDLNKSENDSDDDDARDEDNDDNTGNVENSDDNPHSSSESSSESDTESIEPVLLQV